MKEYTDKDETSQAQEPKNENKGFWWAGIILGIFIGWAICKLLSNAGQAIQEPGGRFTPDDYGRDNQTSSNIGQESAYSDINQKLESIKGKNIEQVDRILGRPIDHTPGRRRFEDASDYFVEGKRIRVYFDNRIAYSWRVL